MKGYSLTYIQLVLWLLCVENIAGGQSTKQSRESSEVALGVAQWRDGRGLSQAGRMLRIGKHYIDSHGVLELGDSTCRLIKGSQ